MLSKSEVKYIQSLSQKKFRQQENTFIAEGPKIIEEALNSEVATVKKIFALPGWVLSNNIKLVNTEVTEITDADLERISQLKTPNQVLALMEMPTDRTLQLNKEKLALALDGIQDPGNMGTIIRIADWFGINQIFCSKDCADIYNSKVVQATMGSLFRTSVFYTDLPEWLAEQKDVILYGTTLNGYPLKSYKNITRGILVIGNESKGIRPEIMQKITQKITIEKMGEAESLNAAVATGIILSQVISF